MNYLKFNQSLRAVVFLFICVFISNVWSINFVHPGSVNSKEELDFVKAKIAAQENPWYKKYNNLVNSGSANRTPNPLTIVDAKDDGQAGQFRDDAMGAYNQALLWYYSGDEAYAQSAVAILNAWTSLEDITSSDQQKMLVAGWIGAVMAPAAEILRLYPGWTETEQIALQDMFKKVFYPLIQTASTWNGNVDLTQIDAMISIAVFNEDEQLFNDAITRMEARMPAYFFLVADGTPATIAGSGNLNSFWANPTDWVDGLTQESCRDNGHHAQFALGSALHVAEVAHHQGVDIFTTYQDRFIAAMELLSLQLYSMSMQGTCANDITTSNVFDSWEVGYNHYSNRKGIPMPNTKTFVESDVRIMGQTSWNLVGETLTHANVDYDADAVSILNHPSFRNGSLNLNQPQHIIENSTHIYINRDGNSFNANGRLK